MSIFIIAEIGINHNGDVNIAKKMIDEAKKANVDCVKFQTFKAHEFISDAKQTYSYKSNGEIITESMLEMFKRYEFTKNEWIEIIEYCKEKEIVFSSTAQNKSDLDFLLSLTNLPFIKVGSDDLTNLELLKYYASKQIPMIISVGMAYASEIEDAISSIREMKNNDITVLHCISSYPAEANEVNLKKIPIIRDAFSVKVGFSDHTIGNAAAVGSICFGAKIIEKHFTLDNTMPGPDHWFSINSKELKQYTSSIKFIEKCIGNGELRPTHKEIETRKIGRRKIVAKYNITKNSKISEENTDFKRVEKSLYDKALDPKDLKFILNRKVKKDIEKNEIILLEELL